MILLLMMLLMVSGGGAYWALAGGNDTARKRAAAIGRPDGKARGRAAKRECEQDGDHDDHWLTLSSASANSFSRL